MKTIESTVSIAITVPTVGDTAIITAPVYVGSVVSVTRQAETYFSVVARRTLRDEGRASAAVWRDALTGQYVVDYWRGGCNIEVDRTRGLRAALSGAVWSVSERGQEDGWW